MPQPYDPELLRLKGLPGGAEAADVLFHQWHRSDDRPGSSELDGLATTQPKSAKQELREIRKSLQRRGGSTFARMALATAAHAYAVKEYSSAPSIPRPAEIAAKVWGDEDPSVGLLEQKAASKSMTSTDIGLSPEATVHPELLEQLVPRVAVRRLGPATPPMAGGQYKIHRVTQGAEARYRDEGKPIVVSRMKHGEERLDCKFIDAMIPVTIEYLKFLLRGAPLGNGTFSIEAHVLREAARRIALREDRAFLRDPGTKNTPRGLKHWALPSNLMPYTGGETFREILNFIGRMISRLEEQDLNVERPAWVMGPRTKNYLMFSALTVHDLPYFAKMMGQGELFGYRYAATNHVPSNLGVDGTDTELALIDMEKVLIPEGLETEVSSTTEGSYWEDGELKSAWANNEMVIKVSAGHDLGVENREAVVWGTDVDFDKSWALAA